MARGKDTDSVIANVPRDLKQRVERLANHRGQSISATAGDALRDAVLAYEGGDTNRAKIGRMEPNIAVMQADIAALREDVGSLKSMVGMLLRAQYAGGRIVKMEPEEVTELNRLIAIYANS